MNDDDRVDAILGECRERLDRGESVDPDAVLRAHPDLAEVLRGGLIAMGRAATAYVTEASGDGGVAQSLAGRPLGPYRIVREIGRGGQATVYLADDTRLPRKVALKVFAPGVAPSDQALARFRREADAAARLDHPGICTIHEAGIDGGTPWIAMRYVEGTTLAACIDATRARDGGSQAPSSVELPSPADAPRAGRDASLLRVLALGEKAARALHAAHEAGLLHRDVKPGNIMVTPGGEPVLLDFGLAREDEAGTTLTVAGALVGTPAYMAPEQLLPEQGRLDRRADVYSLGVTMYECLTLRLPFDGPTREAVFRRILSSDADPPRRWNPQIPRDVETVLTTALERDRERRYATALDLAEDLRRLRHSEPIRARPTPVRVRVLRWAQRHPVRATVATALCAASLLGAGVVERQRSGRRATERRAGEETHRRVEALVGASEFEMSTNPMGALLLAREAARLDPSRGAIVQLRRAIEHSAQRVALRAHEGPIHTVEFSPGGERIATASADGTARLWDVEGRPLAVLAGHASQVNCASFSRDGRRLVTASIDGTARVWDVASGALTAVLKGHERSVRTAMFFPAGDRVVTASDDKTARVWNLEIGGGIAVLRGHAHWVLSATCSPDGQRIVTASPDGTARIWSPDGREMQVLRRHSAAVNQVSSAAFSRTGDRVVTPAWDRTARLWDTVTGREVAVLSGHSDSVRSASIDSVSGLILTTSFDRTARLWDPEGKPLATLRGHTAWVERGCFAPQGDLAATASDDGTVRCWGTDGREVMVLRGHAGQVRALAFSTDGSLLASASHDGLCVVWDVACVRRSMAGSDGASAAAKAVGDDTSGGPDLLAVSDKDLLALAETRILRDFSRVERERYADLLGPGNVTELEAHRALDRLHAGTVLVCELADSIRGDRSLPGDVREAASRIAEDRRNAPDSIHAAVRPVVRVPGRSREECLLALRRMEVAARLDPGHCSNMFLLSLAQYRVELYGDALSTLLPVDASEIDARQGGVVEDAALLAMCHMRLGHVDDARAQILRMRELAKRSSRDSREDADALVREAEALVGSAFGGAPSDVRPTPSPR